jgi:hypothetical protein
MKWLRGLYLGERAKKSKYKVFGRIRRNRFQLNTYLIALSDNPSNLLDLFSANLLNQPYYKKKKNTKNLYIVGLAVGYDEGLEVVRQIIDDVYQNTGGFDIRGFLHFGSDTKSRSE